MNRSERRDILTRDMTSLKKHLNLLQPTYIARCSEIRTRIKIVREKLNYLSRHGVRNIDHLLATRNLLEK